MFAVCKYNIFNMKKAFDIHYVNGEEITIPTANLLAGTIGVAGDVVTGTGTTFLADFLYNNDSDEPKGYLYIPGIGIWTIKSVNSNTSMTLNKIITVPAASPYYIILFSDQYKTLKVDVDSGGKIYYADTSVGEVGMPFTIRLDNAKNGCGPIAIKPSGNLLITVEY